MGTIIIILARASNFCNDSYNFSGPAGLHGNLVGSRFNPPPSHDNSEKIRIKSCFPSENRCDSSFAANENPAGGNTTDGIGREEEKKRLELRAAAGTG
ncbi:MAG: hypothetical protein RBS34_06715, partial [Desulfofustis sp.]|nr:hypothetical protein [Desulfofustis sp.]